MPPPALEPNVGLLRRGVGTRSGTGRLAPADQWRDLTEHDEVPTFSKVRRILQGVGEKSRCIRQGGQRAPVDDAPEWGVGVWMSRHRRRPGGKSSRSSRRRRADPALRRQPRNDSAELSPVDPFASHDPNFAFADPVSSGIRFVAGLASDLRSHRAHRGWHGRVRALGFVLVGIVAAIFIGAALASRLG
jgi:hypothetical protein